MIWDSAKRWSPSSHRFFLTFLSQLRGIKIVCRGVIVNAVITHVFFCLSEVKGGRFHLRLKLDPLNSLPKLAAAVTKFPKFDMAGTHPKFGDNVIRDLHRFGLDSRNGAEPIGWGFSSAVGLGPSREATVP
jgi:hypothetical protein